jgi:hypothetical protein
MFGLKIEPDCLVGFLARARPPRTGVAPTGLAGPAASPAEGSPEGTVPPPAPEPGPAPIPDLGQLPDVGPVTEPLPSHVRDLLDFLLGQ